MTNPRIDAKLVGPDEDGGSVYFDDFRHFCDILNKCLKRCEKVITGKRGRMGCRLARLGTGSACMDLEAVWIGKGTDRRIEVVSLFHSTIAELVNGNPPDSRLGPDAISDFKELKSGLQWTKEVWIGGAQLTAAYVAYIDEYLKPDLTSEGSVTGVLENLLLHDKNEFVIFPALGGRVVCTFAPDRFEKVRNALKRNVTVSGTLLYHSDKAQPIKVQVKDLDIHPPDSELPTLGSLRGLLRGRTNGKTAVEFVRAIRDEKTREAKKD